MYCPEGEMATLTMNPAPVWRESVKGVVDVRTGAFTPPLVYTCPVAVPATIAFPVALMAQDVHALATANVVNVGVAVDIVLEK